MEDITQESVHQWIPRRRAQSDKNDYGRVWAFCGSEGYTGAPYFAAQAAVRTGSGVVTLAIPKTIYPILAIKLNEPVLASYDDTEWKIRIEQAKRADACLIGSGLGHFTQFRELTWDAIQHLSCPLVLDADGINALCQHIDILYHATQPPILTPHIGEFARLTGMEHPKTEDLIRFAVEYRCVLVLKGHRTLVAAPDGTITRNTTGNPGMAKGGSGDVLAGMIVSLLGQGLSPERAARAGVWLHGRAGDLCANRMGEYSMTPTDLLYTLPSVLRVYNTREW